MIRILNESSRDKLAALKHDLKLLVNCDTFEDVQNSNFRSFRLNRMIPREMERKGIDFEEAKDTYIEFLIDMMKEVKRDIELEAKYNKGAKEIMNRLENGLSDMYDVRRVDDETLHVIPPEDADHGDCIEFVDRVVEIINGNYYGTGRGGSWTQWNLVADNGVEVQAGWAGSFDKGIPRGHWVVKI